MEQETFSKVKKGNVTYRAISTPLGTQGQTPIFSLTKDGETVKYSTDGVNYEILGGGGAVTTVDTVVLSSASWFSIASTYSPYTYGYTALISKLTPVSVELVNNQPVVFAKYGFAITSINTTDNTDYNIAFVISLSQPDVDVTLKFITEVN